MHAHEPHHQYLEIQPSDYLVHFVFEYLQSILVNQIRYLLAHQRSLESALQSQVNTRSTPTLERKSATTFAVIGTRAERTRRS